MGNASRPGTVVVREIDHEPFTVDAEQYLVRELVWNDFTGRSYELVRCHDDQVLTEDESFDRYPTDAQVAVVLEGHGIDAELETCKMCQQEILQATAHRHDNGWVGSCCWDERLRAPSKEWRESLSEWDLLSIARTAIELFSNYGDTNDVLSSSQVETLERARALLDFNE